MSTSFRLLTVILLLTIAVLSYTNMMYIEKYIVLKQNYDDLTIITAEDCVCDSLERINEE